ncbi:MULTISPECIES: PQQ-dependent sugar dehydrogenase [unclassified Roseitalea]|uniref:PQQ-dependent sugar dehydrogenase n=1 Tax=unclassified Roseitalea TaxID=2639107 RepID=UPI00273D6AD6|nr:MULTISPECIES: PQQ-dependent sugar dehydrogenase [unclassified Roseitalea]
MTPKRHATTIAATGLAAALSATAAPAQTVTETTEDGFTLTAETVADGLAHPWAVELLPDGALLVTEREGSMRIVRDGAVSAPVDGLPEIAVVGQGGLLDVAIAPDYAQTGEVYFTFAEPGPGGVGTALAKGVLTGADGADPELADVETVFSMNEKSSGGRHFGSRTGFWPDGTVYVTTGDRGERPRAQEMDDHAGAVIRIDRDGTIPDDNPFVGESGAAPELWSKGHRNIQGADIDPETGRLWTVEHGARGGDEINRPEAGLNYGWPEISYGRHYSGMRIGRGTEAPGFEQPVYYWDPSIAPSGLAIYDGAMFAEWQGDMLVGALAGRLLSRLDRNEAGEITGEERLFEDDLGRIRDVDIAPDGSFYLAIDDNPGQIVHVTRGPAS